MYSRSHLAAMALLIVAGFLAATLSADEPNKSEPKKAAAKRVPWTTSKIVGTPEPPPPFKAVRVFPNVKLDKPTLMARCPGTDRLFVGEQSGTLYSIANKPDAKLEVFLDLKKEFKSLVSNPKATGIGELYGLVFHPKFEQNRYCYVCYTLAGKGKIEDGSRVSRFTVTKTEPPRIDPKSEEIVITFVGGGHNGGDLHFGPNDGMLYISTGDAASPNPPDPLNTGQDCSDLLSSILRIDVDHKDPGKNYAIPNDNPFVGMKDVRPEIWAYGFRNPWRMSFDRKTGDLWVGDVGWELWEMVHKIEKGGNYGWSITEGPQPIKPNQKPGPTPIRPPAIEISHTIGTSVTGGYVYRGKKFPELQGAYIFGDWETRRIWAARFDGDRLKEWPEIVKLGIRMSAFGEDNNGEIYILEYDHGTILTLERNNAAGQNVNFPKKLSETGLYEVFENDSGRDMMIANGVYRFSPITGQWQDGADSSHYIALPGLSTVKLFDKPRPLPGQVFWHDFKMQFPPGAVLVKTISVVGGPPRPLLAQQGRNIETQVLHFDGEDWHAYTYAWRDDETDADLVPAEGAEKTLQLRGTEPGQKIEKLWTFHSRTQCMTCHNSWSEYALGFSPGQLNDHPDGRENQLVRLAKEGLIQRVGDKDEVLPLDLKSVDLYPAYVWPHNPHAALDKRARSYLHANCAHCHRFGGGGGQVVLEMDFSRPLKDTGLLDVPPKQGDFGIPNARIIAPGDPNRSVLFYRMAKFGHGRMPHLGSERPDTYGLELIAEWIYSLGKKPVTALPETAKGVEEAFRATNTALPFALAMPWWESKEDEKKVLAAAVKLPPGPVRDLFEGYLPPDPKGRKIGSNPRPASILGLKGDAGRGEKLFFAEAMQCAKCHKIGDRGTALGPDLTAIGKDRTKAELLESVLEPSRRVEPKYASFLVKTVDGRTFTGLLVKRDDKQVILRDAENKEIVLAAADVEAVQPSRLSLMPDGQVAGLRHQEAADLIEYLSSRK